MDLCRDNVVITRKMAFPSYWAPVSIAASCLPTARSTFIINREHFWTLFNAGSSTAAQTPLCVGRCYRGIVLYLEYQSACPFVRIGSIRSISRKRVCPPPGAKGGRATFASGWGGGGTQFGRLERKLALALCTELCGVKQGVTKRCRLSWLLLRGINQWVKLCTWSPNKLWRSTSIFNLWVEPRTVATLALAIRRSNHSFRSRWHTFYLAKVKWNYEKKLAIFTIVISVWLFTIFVCSRK